MFRGAPIHRPCPSLALRDARFRRSSQGEGGRRFRRSTLAMSTQRAAPGLAQNPHGEERRRRVSNREAPAAPDSRRARLNVSPRPYAIISRGASRPSFRIRFALITKEGAGKAGRWPRPWPACSKKSRRQSPQVWPGTPGLPRATVGTAYTWSPWCTGLVGHHARRRLRTLAAGHQHRGVRTARLRRAQRTVRRRDTKPRCDSLRPSHPTSHVS